MRQTNPGCGKCSPAQGNMEYESPRPVRGSGPTGRKHPRFSLQPILNRALAKARSKSRSKREFEFPGAFSDFEQELAADQLTKAVEANRRHARQLGWGCVVHDKLQLNEPAPRPEMYRLLGLGARPTEEDFARAVEQFQVRVLRQPKGDGQLGPGTWSQLVRRGALPATRFAPFSHPVFFGGRKIGIIEKTRAYERCFFDPADAPVCHPARSGVAGEGAGAMIELGFRVTDMDAVRRAGFVDGYNEDYFRWIQVVQFITRPVLNPDDPDEFIRRASGEIDPTTAVGIPSEHLDLHPYYWDEVTRPGADPLFNIDRWINTRAQNGICYDLIFQDVPGFPLTTVDPPAPWTRPGSHAYFNFELALVGVKPGEKIQNTVLSTIKWGFDIFMKDGRPNVDLNGLHPGVTTGSPFLKQVLSRNFARADVPFPGHCMTGNGYTGRADCRNRSF